MPYTPGYRILKESRTVLFVSGRNPELRVQSEFTLENSGTSDLGFVDVTFPNEKSYGRKDLQVDVDGRQVTPVDLPEENQASEPDTLRIAMVPVWRRKQKRELAVEYTFSSPQDSGARITIGEYSFHLGSRGWSPLPRPPRHFLAPYPSRPARTNYTIQVPADFLVLARGTLVGRKRNGEESAYRFELRKNDLTPFVVAGRYVASSPDASANSAVFWTFQPLRQDPSPALERINSAWNVLQNDFGPVDENIRKPHVVEASGLRAHITGEPGPAAVNFPGGVLVDSEALGLGIDSDGFLERVTHALAHNWFGNAIFFSPYAAVGLGEGLPEYATVVVEEAQRGEAGRRQRAVDYLRDYDAAVREASEKPLGITMMNDPPEQRDIALAKAALFFIAVEDVCGEGPMRSGLKRMTTLLRGQEASYDALRSALEESSGKNLAPLFRVWLNDKGIPPDFRARYEGRQGDEGR